MENNVRDYLDFTYLDMLPEDREKFDVGDIYDNKIQCKLCGWIIRSKNRHHFVRCKCGKCAIDGGSWYQKISAEDFGNVINRVVYFTYPHKDKKEDEK